MQLISLDKDKSEIVDEAVAKDTSDEDTSDEDTSDEDTSDEDTADEDTADEDTADEDTGVVFNGSTLDDCVLFNVLVLNEVEKFIPLFTSAALAYNAPMSFKFGTSVVVL